MLKSALAGAAALGVILLASQASAMNDTGFDMNAGIARGDGPAEVQRLDGSFEIADARIRMLGHGGLHSTICQPYDGGGIDDGCDALVALGHVGLYTVNSLNGLGAGNAFFSYARQNGQGAYVNGALPSNHPINFNQPGGDYGIGPWSTGLVDVTTYNWAANEPRCSYSASSHYLRCNLTGSYAPNVITGSITGGVLTVTGGTNPSIGQYVWSGAVSSPVYPYQIVGGSAGVYTLAGSPPNVASQTLNTSSVLSLRGFLFNDVYLYVTGAGVVDAEDNELVNGVNTCGITGEGLDFGSMTSGSGWIYSNYLHESAVCNALAMLWPAVGVQQASFNGTTNGTNLTINSGASPAIGQYINGAGFSTTTQVISGSAPNFVLSNSEPALTEAMTSGPILTTKSVGVTLPSNGAGSWFVQWNYFKSAYGLGSAGLNSISCKYNFLEVNGFPTQHIDICFSSQPQVSGGTTGATYTIASQIEDADTVLVDDTSISGIQNGGSSGTYAQGSIAALGTFFVTSTPANVSGGYYIHTNYVEIENNVLIANQSNNNNTQTYGASGYAIRFLTQGSSTYYGSVGSAVISGNVIDPHGLYGCILVDPQVYTTPGGSTTLSPTITNNVSLYDGSAATQTQCNGHS